MNTSMVFAVATLFSNTLVAQKQAFVINYSNKLLRLNFCSKNINKKINHLHFENK